MTFHKLARLYVKYLTDSKPAIVEDDVAKEKIVESILEEINKNENAPKLYKNKSAAFFCEEIRYIQRFGFKNCDEYCSATLYGKQGAVTHRENRKLIFSIYEAYVDKRNLTPSKFFGYKRKYQTDYEDLASFTLDLIDSDPKAFKSSPFHDLHIVIDEGQDLSRTMLKLLIRMAGNEGSITFFGDVAQQIYGSRISWKELGLNIRGRRVMRLTRNYRNTIEIQDFSRELIKSPYWKNDEDLIDAADAVKHGEKPLLLSFATPIEETSWLLNQFRNRRADETTAIVCRTNDDAKNLVNFLEDRNINTFYLHKNYRDSNYNNMIYIVTYHSAKGLEFDNVYIPRLSERKYLELQPSDDEQEIEEFYANELKLLYVAATRARKKLIVTINQEEQLSRLFPQDSPTLEKICA